MSVLKLPAVKREIKKMEAEGRQVQKITVSYASIWDGYDVFVNVWFNVKVEDVYTFMLAENEGKESAMKRARRAAESLKKAGYKSKYIGDELSGE